MEDTVNFARGRRVTGNAEWVARALLGINPEGARETDPVRSDPQHPQHPQPAGHPGRGSLRPVSAGESDEAIRPIVS